jgi:hypothetical protein
MATTTNYSWSTPDDTALVKDGAAAIRSLGTAIDTTVFTNAGAAINKSIVDAAGDLIYGTADNTVARLALGTASQILRVNSGATAPEWATPAAAGGMTLITETVASANTGIAFTSIPGTYKQLLLVWCGMYHSIAGSEFYLKFNNSASAVYATGNISEGAAALTIQSTRGAGYNTFGQNNSSTSIEKTMYGSCLIDNYASSTKAKFYELNYSLWDNTYSAIIEYRTVAWFNDATAITSLDIVRATGSATLSNAANTSIRLYGIS